MALRLDTEFLYPITYPTSELGVLYNRSGFTIVFSGAVDRKLGFPTVKKFKATPFVSSVPELNSFLNAEEAIYTSEPQETLICFND